ncbi:alpha/beta fold hydrolase [Brevundimonas sp.]|uniref:alpha/beta fold hydrolase n=1 Tax=Brevundimonas sp. TaxID=1871086 RepID=UPI002FC93AE9
MDGAPDGSIAIQPRRLSVPVSNRYGEGQMAVLDFGPADRPVDLVFAHANGFNAYTYRQLLSGLASRLRIWAVDLRGHGRTTLPARTQGRRNWNDHRDDLISLLNTIDGPPVALCGHSIGGTSSLLAAAKVPHKVSHLILLDPVIWSFATTAVFNTPVLNMLAARAPIVQSTLRRRASFNSREQAFNSWRGRGAFKGWPDAVLADYLTDGLLEDGEGLKLACAPAWEASNYSAQAHNPWKALRQYDGPVQLLRAETGTLCAVTRLSSGPQLSISTVAGSGHLFPMTHPQVVREVLSDLAA